MRFSSFCLILTVACVAATDACALGLGTLRSNSRIGEKLHAEIDVLLAEGETLEPGCVHLGSPQGEPALPVLQKAAVSVRHSDPPAIIVRSGEFIETAAVRLSVSVGCGYHVRRDYVVRLGETTPLAEPSTFEPATDFSRRQRPAAPTLLPASAPVPSAAGARRGQGAIRLSSPADSPVRDRLLLGAPPGDAGQPFLRLATELASWSGDSSASEAQRQLWRLEYRMLQTLHQQADGQLDTAAKLRQMDVLLGELQHQSETLASRAQSRAEAPQPVVVAPVAEPVAVPATPAPAPVAVTDTPAEAVAAAPKAEAKKGGILRWVIIVGFWAAILGVLGLLVGKMFKRKRRWRRATDPPNIPVPEPRIDPQRPSEIDDFPSVAATGPEGAAIPVLTADPHETEVASVFKPSIAAASIDEHFEVNPVMELADIMLSFGRVRGAAQALQEFIDQNPDEALKPWIRLMDVYRMAGMRSEFERVAAELNQHFNVEIQRWDSALAARSGEPVPVEPAPVEEPVEPLPIEWHTTARVNRCIEDLEHIADHIVATWPRPECAAYLDKLLRDNRGGIRSGFSLPVVDEIMFLVELLETLAKLEDESALQPR